MYWDEELTRIGVHKAALRRSIARNRARCVESVARLARPLALLDRIVAMWRVIRPSIKFGAVPLGLLVTRLALPRRGILRLLVRWGPLAFAVARAVGLVTNGDPHKRPLPREHRGGSAGLPRRIPRLREKAGGPASARGAP